MSACALGFALAGGIMAAWADDTDALRVTELGEGATLTLQMEIPFRSGDLVAFVEDGQFVRSPSGSRPFCTIMHLIPYPGSRPLALDEGFLVEGATEKTYGDHAASLLAIRGKKENGVRGLICEREDGNAAPMKMGEIRAIFDSARIRCEAGDRSRPLPAVWWAQ